MQAISNIKISLKTNTDKLGMLQQANLSLSVVYSVI